MFASPKIVTVAVLALSTILGSGCTHAGPVTHTVNKGGRDVYTSSQRAADGTLRATVHETVVGSDDACEILRIERHFYDDTGMLIERTLDRERCRVVEYRISSLYDIGAGKSTTVTSVDRDHDGSFDSVATQARSLRQSEIVMLDPGQGRDQ